MNEAFKRYIDQKINDLVEQFFSDIIQRWYEHDDQYCFLDYMSLDPFDASNSKNYKFRLLNERLDRGFICLLKLDLSKLNINTSEQFLKESIAELIEHSLYQLSSSSNTLFDEDAFDKEYTIEDMNGRGYYTSMDIENGQTIVADVISFHGSPLFDEIEKLPHFGLDEIKFVKPENLEWHYRASAEINVSTIKKLTRSGEQVSMSKYYTSITLKPDTISDGSYVKKSDGTIVTDKKQISKLFKSVPVNELEDWILANNDGGVDEGFIVVKK